MLTQTQNSVSALLEGLETLPHLIKTTATPGQPINSVWLTPDGLRAVSMFVGAVAWPLLVLVLVLIFLSQLKDLFRRLTEFEFLGVKGKIQSELRQSAQAAESELRQSAQGTQKSEGLSPAPTPGELQRAIQVEKLSSGTDLSLVRQQVDELAAEYERVRASMRGGVTRTRAMEVVVAKMRTIGRAAYPLRHELSVSPSPGHRLQAIASLEVIPDYDDFLDWLVDRIDKERPFLGYHALVALNAAADNERAYDHLEALENAMGRAREKRAVLSRDTDRQRLITQFEKQVEQLRKTGVHA